MLLSMLPTDTKESRWKLNLSAQGRRRSKKTIAARKSVSGCVSGQGKKSRPMPLIKKEV